MDRPTSALREDSRGVVNVNGDGVVTDNGACAHDFDGRSNEINEQCFGRTTRVL